VAILSGYANCRVTPSVGISLVSGMYNSCMLGWLNTWILSHTDTRFFRRADQYKPDFFAMYLLSIYLVLAAVSTTLFAFRTLPTWTNHSTELWLDLQKNWSENVELSLQDNRLQVEGAEELVLPIPEHLANRYSVPSYFLLASNELQTASQSATPAAFIATTKAINIWNPDGSYRQELWSNFDFGSISWNKNSFSSYESQFREVQEMVGWFSLITFFILNWLGLLALRVLGLVLYAWVGQSLLWLSGNRLPFGQTYKIGLFLLPIAEEILLFAKILYPTSAVLSFWLVWFLLLAAIAFTNRSVLGNRKS